MEIKQQVSFLGSSSFVSPPFWVHIVSIEKLLRIHKNFFPSSEMIITNMKFIVCVFW